VVVRRAINDLPRIIFPLPLDYPLQDVCGLPYPSLFTCVLEFRLARKLYIFSRVNHVSSFSGGFANNISLTESSR
jgi:hypothetical protein